MKTKVKNKKGNQKRLKIVFFVVLIFIILILAVFIVNAIKYLNDKKINNAINEVSKERIDYVFIEINPSFVLTVKNNIISDVACLNEDCLSFYDEIEVKGKDISEGIDNLYNISKDKGYDVSNGVKVKISDNVSLKEKDYVLVEYIDEKKEKELLNEIKNNEDIKDISNDSFYSKLWEELKKDSSYDDVYTCSMNDEEKLECHIILETGINKDSDYDSNTEEEYNRIQEIFYTSSSKILNTLKKFNFDVRDKKVYINDIAFGYVPFFTLNEKYFDNVLTAEKIEVLEYNVCDYGLLPFMDGKCQARDGVYLIPLEKINLVNPTSAINNIIVHSNEVVENALKQYEAVSSLNN